MFNILEVHAVLKNFLHNNVRIFVLGYYSIQSRHRIAVCTVTMQAMFFSSFIIDSF